MHGPLAPAVPQQQPAWETLWQEETVSLASEVAYDPAKQSLKLANTKLASDGLEDRLLNQLANPEGPCAGGLMVDGKDPEHSLLLQKVSGASTCGSPMPLTKPSALNDDQVRCIEEYVVLVAAGGRL